MMKMIALWVVLGTLAGSAFAQPGAGSDPAAAPAAAGEPAPAGRASPAPPPAQASPAADARKACATAMNADPQVAAEIIATLHDKDTIAVHTDANYHVQKNERHVIYAYAA